MVEAFRAKGYNARYMLGENVHGSKLGGRIFPDSMRWLWNDQLLKSGPYQGGSVLRPPPDQPRRLAKMPFGNSRASQKPCPEGTFENSPAH